MCQETQEQLEMSINLQAEAEGMEIHTIKGGQRLMQIFLVSESQLFL